MKSVVGHFLRLIVLLVLVAAGTFVLLSFSPVDPIRAYIGNDLLHVPPEQYARIAARWGLDQPLWERFGHWFLRVLQGDLGYSMLFNAPVASVIKERFSTSFALLGGAWLLSGILGTAMGFVAGRYLNRWPDKAICRLSYLLSSLPTFWIGMLLLALFAVRWPVFRSAAHGSRGTAAIWSCFPSVCAIWCFPFARSVCWDWDKLRFIRGKASPA